MDAQEDPLVAALPPNTDYLTYLTLLEYQLRPGNLSTLNRLLSEDNGTLAAEIGWDLLKLVLPMLQIVPEEANKCLSIIARRGNPREVVIRVSEELERLGQDENEDEETDEDDDIDQDGLPTFAGEAPRIHLGEMKLDGMPPPQDQPQALESVEEAHRERRVSSTGESGSDDVLILQALLSMIGSLHPRIKTQYPSRFLATSLPAALGAYRRVKITPETTSAFVDTLAKLSGKQRPMLPPRISTAASIPTTTVQSIPESTVMQAPLPDPEAKTDTSSNNVNSATNERAITQRLLQAVMLEVLDECTASFQSTEQPSVSWTVRSREKHEPKRVLPGRPTETQRWTQSVELKTRDEMIAKFLKLSKDLNLDIGREINKLAAPDDDGDAEIIEQAESDYPTSPSQIPFPSSGLVLLFAAQNFAQNTTGLTNTPPVSLSAVRTLFRTVFALPQELPHPPSLSQTDALLSLIYTTLQSPLSQPALQHATATASSQSSAADLPFLTNLTNLFTTSPDPHIRDSTHHLTTLLLHNHTTSEIKLLYLKSLLSPLLSPASPVFDIQQGNLRALAINWLKDEFLSYHTTNVPRSDLPQVIKTETADESSIPIQPPILQATQSPSNPGLDPNLMHTDPDIVSLIFPQLPTPPSPFITGHPAAQGKSISTKSPMSSSTDLESLLLQIPAYIASLNLTCILASLPSNDHENESVLSVGNSAAEALSGDTTTTSATTGTLLLQNVTRFLQDISQWTGLLAGFSTNIAKNQAARGGDPGPVNVSDVYALEDAVGRAKSVLEAL